VRVRLSIIAVVLARASASAQQPVLSRFAIPVDSWHDFAPLYCEKVISVAAAGDVDHDGVCDIAVGFPLYGVPGDATRPIELPDADRGVPWLGEPSQGVFTKWRNGAEGGGRVVFLSSRDGSEVRALRFGWQQRIQAGYALAQAGDCNGDGIGDTLIAAPDVLGYGSPGCVELQSGADGVVLQRWWGAYDTSEFGWSVARLGDLDGDGSREFAFGAPQRQDTGYAVVVSGRTNRTLYKLDGAPQRDRFGTCIASCGDVDADGTDDFVIGANQSSGLEGCRGVGYVCVYSGRTGRLIRKIAGANEGSAFGDAACGVGDLDGDGGADVAVSAPLTPLENDSVCEGNGRSQRGGAVLFHSGASGSLLGRITGVSDRDEVGSALLPIARQEDPGKSDLLVGVPGRGEVWLVSTVDFRVVKTIHAEPGFGRALADLGDVDADGLRDYAVGAFQYGVTSEPAVYLLPGKAFVR
jgi:hypothetical protein